MSLFRRHVWLIVALAPIAALYFRWTWNGEIGSLFNDGVCYLVMAQHYAPGGAADAAVAAAAFSRFPPLYPLMLAWSGAAFDLYLAHTLTTAFLLLGLIGLYAWMRNTGLASAQAALLTLSFAALPGSWLAGLLIQSEYLYLLWSLLALALLTAHHDRQRDGWLLAAALAVAAATLTRTIGITLLPPLLLAALRAGRRTGLLSLAAALLPVLLWHAVHSSRGNSYGDSIAGFYGNDAWSFLLQQLRSAPEMLHAGFAQNLLQQSHAHLLADLLGALCLAASAWRAIRLQPDAVYVAGYAVVVVLWPYPGEAQRLLWVLLPVLLAQPVLVIAELRKQPPDGLLARIATAACAASILAMVLPQIADAADRYRSASHGNSPATRGLASWYTAAPADSALHARTELSLVEALRAIAGAVPQQDCVISIQPYWVNYYARRRSDYPPRESVPAAYFESALRNTGCHYLLASRFIDDSYPVPLYPLHRLGDRFEVLQYVEMPDAPSAPPLSVLTELR